jgi:hypothetical protein
MNNIDRRRFNAMLAGLGLAGATPAWRRRDDFSPSAEFDTWNRLQSAHPV